MDFKRDIHGSWWPVLSPDQHRRLAARSALISFPSLLLFRFRAVIDIYLLSGRLTECGRDENISLGGICLRLDECASCWRHLLRSSEETHGASGFRRRIIWIIASVLVMLVGLFTRSHEATIA